MKNDIGNYAKHAQYWNWSGYDNTAEHEYWHNYAGKYGKNILIPMCAWGETGAYMARKGFNVTAFDITSEMIVEGKKHYGDIAGLNLFEGDIRNFRFDIVPADFCYSMDFGHLLTINDIKKALVCINNHLRDGGGLVIETSLPPTETYDYPLQTFIPPKQVYPGLKVWKTSEGRVDAGTARNYISQKFYAEDEHGNTESFEHEFYLQSYSREEWLAALKECGFDVVRESDSREVESWQSGDDFLIIEAVKSTADKSRYCPTVSFDYLQTPVYRYENVALYNDFINLEQPNSGYFPHYKFDINADGDWVGSVFVRIGYTINIKYNGHLGYWINEDKYKNKGYMTKALLALKPFLIKCGFKYVLISNSEDNGASRRVCEKIGATLLETVDTPEWHGLYGENLRTCIWEWKIED